MKRLITKFAIAIAMIAPLALALPASAAAPSYNVSGAWVIDFTLGGVYSHDMTLTQDGAGNITGVGGGYPAGGAYSYTWVIDSGIIDGNTINLTAHYTGGPDAVTPLTVMHMTGTILGDGSMSGTWDDNYGGGSRNGTWASASGAATPISTTVVVSGDTAAGENQPGWLFNRDLTTATPFAFTTNAASIGTGSIEIYPIGANASDKFIAENFINTLISNVNSISYDFKIGSTSLDTQEEQFYMSVYANFGVSADNKFYDCRYSVVPTVGSNAGFTTVTFDPTQAYPVTQRFDSPFACPAIPADMDLQSAGSNIRAFSLNVGDTSTSDVGLSGYLDKVVTNLDTGITIYDFEPVSVPPTDTVPTTKSQCMNNGWQTLKDAEVAGKSFKNQGDCVSFVATKGKNTVK
jgi:hypothetical protein